MKSSKDEWLICSVLRFLDLYLLVVVVTFVSSDDDDADFKCINLITMRRDLHVVALNVKTTRICVSLYSELSVTFEQRLID